MNSLKVIRDLDFKYNILKRTSVLLMPRWQKFKCKTQEDLVKALKIEKVYSKFLEDMLVIYNKTADINTTWKFEIFLDKILELATIDFKNGNDREEIVATFLRKNGWSIAEYSDKEAYSNEVKGIDIVATKGDETKLIQVKSGGFLNMNTKNIVKHLTKMVKNGCYLFVVDQHRDNAMYFYNKRKLSKWLTSLESSK